VVVISVSETTVKDAAGVAPKSTAFAVVKSVPVIVTGVPPAVGPALGATELTVGSATNVNWSAGEVEEVPPAVVTVTSTVPTAWAGEVVVISVLETTVKEPAAVVSKSTDVAPVKLVPVMVTGMPPPVGPDVGATAVTVGGAAKVNWSLALVGEVPLGLVTVTSTVPAAWAGEVLVISVSETTVKDAAGVAPKWTEVAVVKLVPVIVTGAPPAVGPALGATELTVGGATKVKSSAGEVAEVPPVVVTVTSTVPAAWGGVVVLILVLETTVNDAGVAPKSTAVAVVKLVPVMVTGVPPALGPDVGATELIVGGATKVK
jgi:hypothetical protein